MSVIKPNPNARCKLTLVNYRFPKCRVFIKKKKKKPLKSLAIFSYMLLQNSASLLSQPLHCQNSSHNQTLKPKSGIKIKVICK